MEMKDEEDTSVKPIVSPQLSSPVEMSSLASGAMAANKGECSETTDKGNMDQPGEGNISGGCTAEAGDPNVYEYDHQKEERPPSNDEDQPSSDDEDDFMDLAIWQDFGRHGTDDEDDSSEGDVDSVSSSSSSSSSDGDEEDNEDRQTGSGYSTESETSSGSGSDLEPSGDEEGELHPMKNPVILKNFFERCPPRLLAKFRLVCKQWLGISLEAWRSSISLQFDYHRGNVKIRVDDDMKYDDIPLNEFVKYVEDPRHQCQLKPFRRYKLSGGFKFPMADNKVKIRKLWEFVERDATHLELYGSSFADVEVFRKVIYQNWSNLQQLKLFRCSIPKSSRNKSKDGDYEVIPANINLKSLSIDMETMRKLPLTWLELLSHFPSLTELSLSITSNGPRDIGFPKEELLGVIDAIQTIRKKDSRKLRLTKFGTHPYFEIAHDDKEFLKYFGLLRDLRLPLQSLKLDMGTKKKLKLHELAGATEIDGSHLRSLTFHQTDRGLAIWKFPFDEPLEDLQVLTLTGINFENMEFLKLVPNLKKLEFIDYKAEVYGEYRNTKKLVAMISQTRKQEMTNVKCLKMTDFTWPYAMTEDDLNYLAGWFPNLKMLHMALEDKLFPILCEGLRELQAVWVEGAGLSDEGITGMKESQCVDDCDVLEHLPNITLLQNLESFTYFNSDQITDVSIFNGFLKLPRLLFLTLGKSAGLTKQAKDALKEEGMLGSGWNF